MGITSCDRCGALTFAGKTFAGYPHTCYRFEVRCPEYDTDWEDVWDFDAEGAVKKWCERFDAQGDYPIVGGGGLDHVQVRGHRIEGVEAWAVVTDTVIEYYADKKEEDVG